MLQPTDLRTSRKRAGLTQEQLADLVGVSQSNIAGMESAVRAVSKTMGNRLAQHVGVESVELVIANRLAAYKRGKQESDARAVLTAAKAIVEAGLQRKTARSSAERSSCYSRSGTREAPSRRWRLRWRPR